LDRSLYRLDHQHYHSSEQCICCVCIVCSARTACRCASWATVTAKVEILYTSKGNIVHARHAGMISHRLLPTISLVDMLYVCSITPPTVACFGLTCAKGCCQTACYRLCVATACVQLQYLQRATTLMDWYLKMHKTNQHTKRSVPARSKRAQHGCHFEVACYLCAFGSLRLTL
jgi:hypothetical protein